jgi:hypothetical protein
MCVTGGRLAEELLEMLPDYELAFMGDEGPAAAAAAAGAIQHLCYESGQMMPWHRCSRGSDS